MKVIFTLPKKLSGGAAAPSFWPREPLAYVEWYTRFLTKADDSHLMYTLRKAPARTDGLPQGKIVPLSRIRQSCHLAPWFPSTVPDAWTTDTVLDLADKFHLNNWSGLYAYQTLW